MSEPTLPAAPARFSTTTGWPSDWRSLSAATRARMSVEPPGAQGTTTRIGFSGQAASAGAVIRRAAAAAMRVFSFVINSSVLLPAGVWPYPARLGAALQAPRPPTFVAVQPIKRRFCENFLGLVG